jgi:hypothetical protein
MLDLSWRSSTHRKNPSKVSRSAWRITMRSLMPIFAKSGAKPSDTPSRGEWVQNLTPIFANQEKPSPKPCGFLFAECDGFEFCLPFVRSNMFNNQEPDYVSHNILWKLSHVWAVALRVSFRCVHIYIYIMHEQGLKQWLYAIQGYKHAIWSFSNIVGSFSWQPPRPFQNPGPSSKQKFPFNCPCKAISAASHTGGYWNKKIG